MIKPEVAAKKRDLLIIVLKNRAAKKFSPLLFSYLITGLKNTRIILRCYRF